MKKNESIVKFIDFDYTVNGHQPGFKSAYGRVTFVVELDGIIKRLCTNLGSKKGGITPEDKKNQLNEFRNYLQEKIKEGTSVGIIVKKTRDGHDVSENDPIYKAINNILNGNK